MKKIYYFFLLFALPLYGSLDSYLKPALGKEAHYNNPILGVDFAYVINLDQRPEKFSHCLNEFSPYGIIPYRFSAVNGWQLDLNTLNQIGVPYKSTMPKDMMGTCYLNEHLQPTHEMMHVIGRNYFCHCLSKGAIGICLSHLSVLKDAYQSGYETIWVMEDDIEVKQDPHILSQLIDELDRLVGKNGWDILFTDPDTKASNGEAVICCSFAKRPNFTPENPEKFAIKTPISPNLRKIGARYGAYSMIVRRSVMKKLLNFFNKYHLFLPFDMDYTLPNDIRLYTVAYDIVSTQPKALSDNGAPNYKRHNKDVSYD